MATGGIVLLAVLFSLSTFNVNFCHAIEFESSVYTYNISEEAVGASGTLCALAILPVATSNAQGSVMYGFVDFEFTSLFHLTTNSRQEECLQNLDLLDREIRESYSFTYRASSSEGNAETTILLTLLDVNDHAPEFDQDSLQSFTVDENSAEGTLVGNITATDPDKAENGTVRYKLTKCNNVFEIGERSGLLTVKSNIDYETNKTFECKVTATDSGQDFRSNYVMFTVNVNNINDNAPNCSNPVLPSSVTENQNVVLFICSLVDADEVGTSNENWLARVENDFDGTFSPFVASFTLFVRISNNTDREKQPEYDIVIKVTDQGMPEQVGTINVHIVVNDTNDNRPECPPGQMVQVSESARNRSLGSVNCSDPDDSSSLKFSLRSVWRGGVQSSERAITVTNSGVIHVVDPIDYDDHPEKTLTLYITVTDGTFTTSVNVTVQIVDANDNPPCFSRKEYNFSIQENSNVGSEVGSVHATDADSGSNSAVVYSIPSPANTIFSINATTGRITTREVLDREEKDRYEFDVMASDGGGPSHTCSRAGVLVHVTNLDDSCPNFRDNYTFEVKQNEKAGTAVGSISAANPEGEPTNAITYRLESAPPYIILQQTNSITKNLILKSNLNDSHVGEETFMAVVSSTKPSCSGGERTYIVLRILRFDQVVDNDPPPWHIIGAVAGLLLVIIVVVIFISGVCCCCVKRQKSITDTYPITNSPAPTSPLELKKHKSILKPCPSESPDSEDPRQKNSVRFVEVISTDDIHIFDREAPPLSPRLSNGHANGKVLEDLDSPEPMHESSSSVGAFEEDSQSLTSNSSFPHQLDISDNINQVYEGDLPPDGYRPPTPPRRRSAEAHLPFAPTNHFQPEHLSSFDRYYSTNNSTWYNVEQDMVGLPSSPQRPHYYYPETGTSVITSDDRDSLSDNYSMYTEPGTDIACGPIESLVARIHQTQQTKLVQNVLLCPLCLVSFSCPSCMYVHTSACKHSILTHDIV